MAFVTTKEKHKKWGKKALLFYKFPESERIMPDFNYVKLIDNNKQGFSEVTINVWISNS